MGILCCWKGLKVLIIWENGNMVKTVVVGKREYTKKYGSEVNITKQNTHERIFDETQGG